jgi:hypothetical protein
MIDDQIKNNSSYSSSTSKHGRSVTYSENKSMLPQQATFSINAGNSFASFSGSTNNQFLQIQGQNINQQPASNRFSRR